MKWKILRSEMALFSLNNSNEMLTVVLFHGNSLCNENVHILSDGKNAMVFFREWVCFISKASVYLKPNMDKTNNNSNTNELRISARSFAIRN